MKPIEQIVVGVVGAGAMGRGIVQLFAQAGHEVFLLDALAGAAEAARKQVASTLASLAERGKITPELAHASSARIHPVTGLGDLAPCDLVIEAIVENLGVKQQLFRELESVVTEQALLASNTSSLSVTAIASACRHPARVAGYHFFNPVPLMKIVEVVRGVRTDATTVERLLALTSRTGHTAVIAQDMPGFLVNHAGRGYGPEALRVVSEGVTDTQTVDRIMREQVNFAGSGFKLGPFELLDLTGLDVSHPVMESIYRQFFDEPRFKPSAIAAQRLAGGLLGRKVGEGFYRHVDGKQVSPPDTPAPLAQAGDAPAFRRVWVAPGPQQQALSELVSALGMALDDTLHPDEDSLALIAPLGFDATTVAVSDGLPAERTVAIDTLFPFGFQACKRRVLMGTPASSKKVLAQAHRLFAADGAAVSVIRDSAGFVAQRVVAMVVAVACEIAQQRIASPADIDLAVRLGLGYPVGPLTMGDQLGPATIAAVLEGMAATTGEPRYRPSLWLERRARLGLSLLHED